MSAATIFKPVSDVVPGDTWVNGRSRNIVIAVEALEDGVEICAATLGNPKSVGAVRFDFTAKFEIELAGLTPVQAAADKLLGYARYYLEDLRYGPGMESPHMVELQALLDELDPPKPPTLEEALSLLRKFESDRLTAEGYDKAIADMRTFLKRVPN